MSSLGADRYLVNHLHADLFGGLQVSPNPPFVSKA